MNHRLSRILALGSTMTVALGLTAMPVAASAPTLDYRVQVAQVGYDVSSNPAGIELIPGVLSNYAPLTSTADFNVSNQINVRPDANFASGAFFSTSATVENNSDQTLDFIITMSVPMVNFGDSRDWVSSVAYTLTGSDAGSPTLAALAGTPTWLVSSDTGDILAWDLPAPLQGISADAQASFDQDSVGAFGPAGPLSDVTIQFGFSLTAGATATVNNSVTFGQVVPAPGGLALIGLGLIGRRRRRR